MWKSWDNPEGQATRGHCAGDFSGHHVLASGVPGTPKLIALECLFPPVHFHTLALLLKHLGLLCSLLYVLPPKAFPSGGCSRAPLTLSSPQTQHFEESSAGLYSNPLLRADQTSQSLQPPQQLPLSLVLSPCEHCPCQRSHSPLSLHVPSPLFSPNESWCLLAATLNASSCPSTVLLHQRSDLLSDSSSRGISPAMPLGSLSRPSCFFPPHEQT